MATKCLIPVRGKRVRVTALDNCGNFPAPEEEDAFVVSDGFISFNLTSEVEDGVEILTRRFDGALCVNEMGDPSFKRFTLEAEFCGVDPGLLSVMTNAVPYLDYNEDVAGFTIPEGTITKRFALELWVGLSGQACATGGEEASGYILLPFVAGGVLGDVTLDGENAATFSMTGASTRGGNAWDVGPWDVLLDTDDTPAPLPVPLDPLDHLLLVESNVAPPVSACGLQAMPPAA